MTEPVYRSFVATKIVPMIVVIEGTVINPQESQK